MMTASLQQPDATQSIAMSASRQNRTEQNRTEQNRTEQNRTEQNRTEQNRTEQNRTSGRMKRAEDLWRKSCSIQFGDQAPSISVQQRAAGSGQRAAGEAVVEWVERSYSIYIAYYSILT
jgi:hypothetical protein